MIEKPAGVDRSMGDVHAAGNPHLHLDPRNLLAVADALTSRLSEIDPEGAVHYAARNRDFAARLQEALRRWESDGAGLFFCGGGPSGKVRAVRRPGRDRA